MTVALKRKRIIGVAIGFSVIGVIGAASLANAQGKEARGSVTAVSNSSLTIASGDHQMTFVIDGSTKLEVKAAAKQSRQAGQANNQGATITEYIRKGNPVLVRYQETNGANHALSVRPVSSSGEGAEAHDPVKTANGTVKTVTPSQLTLQSEGHDMTFAINGDTDVLAKGATKTTKAAGGKTTIEIGRASCRERV